MKVEIQFNSGLRWLVEAPSLEALFPIKGGMVKVTMLRETMATEPKRVEAIINPDMIEGVWLID